MLRRFGVELRRGRPRPRILTSVILSQSEWRLRRAGESKDLAFGLCLCAGFPPIYLPALTPAVSAPVSVRMIRASSSR